MERMKIIGKRKRLLFQFLAVTIIITMLPLTSVFATNTHNSEEDEILDELNFNNISDTDDNTSFEARDGVDIQDANENDLIKDMDLADIPDIKEDSVLKDAKRNTISKFTPSALTLRLLTVTNGTSDNTTYNAGDEVTITADEPEAGKLFDKWVSEDISIAADNNKVYTFTMPDKDVTVTASYKDDPDIKNTTINDMKVKVFSENEDKWEYKDLNPKFNPDTREYNINLDTASYNLVEFSFTKQNNGQSVRAIMEGNSHYLNEDDLSFSTKPYRFTKAISEFIFTVTAKDGITTDSYKIIVKRGSLVSRNLTVINGSSNISNPMLGDKVTITADDPPPGKIFDRWTRDDLSPIYETNTSYTFFMPDWDVKATALYKEEPENPESDTSLSYLTMHMLGDNGFEANVPMNPKFDPQIKKYTVYITPQIRQLRGEGFAFRKKINEQDLEVYVDEVKFNIKANIPLPKDKDKTVVKYKVTSKDKSTSENYEITILRTTKPIICYDILSSDKILPVAFIGKPYTYKFLAERTPNIEWSLTSILPNGLSFDEEKGIISGTPKSVQPYRTFEISVKAKNDHGEDTVTRSITVKNSDNLTGNISIIGKAQFESTLFASLSDSNNTGTLIYEWERDSEIIGVGKRYTLKEDDINRDIYCNVTSTHQKGTISKGIYSINKADGPAAPQGLSVVKPTSAGGEDGKILGTTNMMEYASGSGFQDCQEGETTGLKSGTYYVRVKATKTHSPGDSKKIIIPETTSVPSEPRKFEAIPGEKLGTIRLKWINPVNKGGLDIIRYEVSKDNGENWIKIKTSENHYFYDLTLGANYTFKVRAVNALGEGKAATVTVKVLENYIPELTITMSADKTKFSTAGEIIKYTYLVVNTGNVRIAAPFEIVDDQIGKIAAPADVTGLVPGLNIDFRVSANYKVTQADIDAGFITNKVKVTGKTEEYGDIIGETTLSISKTGITPVDPDNPEEPALGLAVKKSADKSEFSKIGEKIVYTYLVTNTGDLTIEGSLSPTHADSFTLVDDKIGILDTSSAPKHLEPNESFTVSAEYLITENDMNAGFVTNIVTVKGGMYKENDYVLLEDTDTVTIKLLEDEQIDLEEPAPRLTVKKSADKSEFSKIGEKIVYTYLVTNTGDLTIEGSLSPTHADSFTLVDDKIGILDTSSAPKHLEPNESFTVSAEYLITENDMNAGFVTNIVTVKGGMYKENDYVLLEDTDTVTIALRKTEPLEPDKPADPVETDKATDPVETDKAIDPAEINKATDLEKSTLPKAGSLSPILFYGLGGLLILIGITLGKKKLFIK